MSPFNTLSNRHQSLFYTTVNLIVAFILVANGIDHWVLVPVGFYSYFLSSSIVLGVVSVLWGLSLILLEFQYLDRFLKYQAPFVMKPLGRGIIYLNLGILTSGHLWYQILSVVLVMGIGVGLIGLGLSSSSPMVIKGIIPSHVTQTTGVPNDLEMNDTPVVYSINPQ